jgi:hypothetical protein
MTSLRSSQILAALILTAVCALPVRAQMGPGGGGGGMGGFDPSQMRSRITGRIQDQVGFTDEEWAVVEPKIWRVMALQVDTGAGGLGGMLGAFRGRGGAGPGGFNFSTMLSQIFNNGRASVVTTKRDELQAAVDNQDSTPQQLAIKLEEYRTAVKKAKGELVQAQSDLRDVLTLRQEAMLIQMGFLD